MVKYYEISFSYTLKCNALCAHCCVNSTPQNNCKLDLEEAKRFILDAKKYGINFIAYTGGEVTLFKEELFKLFEFAKKNKIKNILVSNAIWATNEKKAEDFVKELKKRGVVEIQVSTDMFHTKFIPFNNVVNAIKAIKKLKIKPVIMLARIKGDTETKELKDKLKKFKIKIIEQPVVPFTGRSQNIPKKRLFVLPLKDMKNIGCISVLSPTISPTKKVYACCASDFSFSDDSSLFLGNLNKESFYQILKKQEKNKLIDAIYLWGPKFLYDLVKKGKPKLVEDFPEEYYGYCDLCYRLAKNKKIVYFLKEKLKDKELQKKISIAKMVKYKKIKEMQTSDIPWYECVIERENA
jgi:MoaA/NifB/PqqE/SkfB family radical SAM enzyme